MKRKSSFPAFVAIVISVLFLATCDLFVTVDWSDYADVNLIAATPLAITTPPTWTPDWDAPYMLFEEVADPGAIGAAPPAALGPVYRLEILNLMPNGTFDADTSPWYAVGDPGIVDHDPAGFMDIEFDAREDRVEFLISDALDATNVDEDEILPLYLFKTRINSVTASFRMEYYDGQTVSGNEITPIRWQFETPFAGEWVLFPDEFELEAVSVPATFFAPRDPGGTFVIGTYSPFEAIQNIALDDFRLVRPDLPMALRLAVPYGDTGRPELSRGGTYTFRVWARTDPTAGTANRIGARNLSVTITNRVGEQTFPVGTSSWTVHEITNDWVEYEATVSGITFPVPADGTTPVIEVVITPTNAGAELIDLDAGSLLLSTPSLEWAPR